MCARSFETLGTSNALRASDGSHLGAVQGDQPAGDQAALAAEANERLAGVDDRLGIVVPEGRNRSVVRHKAAKQPERFEVAQTGALKVARRAHLVQLALGVEPEHVGRVVARAADAGGDAPGKPEVGDVQTSDERIDQAHERIGRYMVVDAGGEQADLIARGSFNEAHNTSADRVVDLRILEVFDEREQRMSLGSGPLLDGHYR